MSAESSKAAEREWTKDELALKAFLEANDHELCVICRCCDAVWEVAACYSWGGFCEPDDDWDLDDGYCATCGGEGEVSYKTCVGGCSDKPHAAAIRAMKGRD
jgi:hypothetical protein